MVELRQLMWKRFYQKQLTIKVGTAVPDADRDAIDELVGDAVATHGLETVAALLRRGGSGSGSSTRSGRSYVNGGVNSLGNG